MMGDRRIRLVVLIGLLVALFGLLVWFGSLSPAPAAGAYPGEEELATDYEQFVGERVVVSGQIIATDPVTIQASYGAGETMTLRVTNVSEDGTAGDSLRVYGVAKPDGEIRALNAFTVPWWGSQYAVGVSALAGVWVFLRTINHWRVDTDDWALERRAHPLAVVLLRRTASEATVSPGDDDA